MKTVLFFIALFLVIAVIAYTWYNRDSDRIMLTFATAMMIGAFGFITKESISNKTEEYTKEIPIVVFYGLPKYYPLNIKAPYTRDMMLSIPSIQEEDLPKNKIINTDFGSKIYFDAIQFTLIATIFERYARAWNVKVKKIVTPTGEDLSFSSIHREGKLFRLQEVMQQLPDNYFVKAKLYDAMPQEFEKSAMFPPDTQINITKNTDKDVTIVFQNKYINFSVNLTYIGTRQGVGEYSDVLGLPYAVDMQNFDNSNKYWHSVYLMTLNVKQNSWLNGHPEMKNNRNWADSIVDVLDNKFNYETIRENR